jgi:hypothetical protein
VKRVLAFAYALILVGIPFLPAKLVLYLIGENRYSIDSKEFVAAVDIANYQAALGVCLAMLLWPMACGIFWRAVRGKQPVKPEQITRQA